MASNITFTMIKPDAVRNGNIGDILKIITDAGFRIVAMKMMQLCEARVNKFYEPLSGNSWFPGHVKYMTSGPIVAIVLEKEDAVRSFRTLIGNTDPEQAAEGTIRKLYAKCIKSNAIHGSDSNENAIKEALFFFSNGEMFDKNGIPFM